MNSRALLKCIYSGTVFSYGQTGMSEVVFTGLTVCSIAPFCGVLWENWSGLCEYLYR